MMKAASVLLALTFAVLMLVSSGEMAVASWKSSRDRSPVPPQEELAAARADLKDSFRAGYASSDVELRRELAEDLLAASERFHDSLPYYYACLDESRDVASKAGSVELGFTVIDQMVGRFELDGQKMRLNFIEQVADSVQEGEQCSAVEAVLPFIEECVASEDYDDGQRALDAFRRHSNNCDDTDIAAAIGAARFVCSEFKALNIDRFKAVLEDDSEDPRANGQVGYFYFFVRGDLTSGLPRLVKGSDKKLAGLAARDLASPTDTGARFELGDDWLTYAKGRDEEHERSVSLSRAVYWLELARSGAADDPGAQIKAERRLAEAQELVAREPMNQQPKPSRGARPKRVPREARVIHGTWKVVGDELIGEDVDPRPGGQVARLAFGDPAWRDYDLSISLMTIKRDAPPTQNPHGCGIRTHFADDDNWYQFSVAGTIVRTVKGNWEAVSRFKNHHDHGRWFAVRLEVRGATVRAYLDGQLVTTYEANPYTSGRIGVQCQDSIVHCKDILVKSPDGVILWEGLPTVK